MKGSTPPTPEELSVRHILLAMQPSYLPMVDDDVDQNFLLLGRTACQLGRRARVQR